MPSTVRDIIGLLSRLSLALVLFAHGYQKMFTFGMDAAGQSFAEMGVPAPELAAWVATLIELIGAIFIALGLFQTVVGTLGALNLLGAVFLVHISNGVFVSDGGYELALIIAALAAMIAAFGSGRFALDHVISKNRNTSTK